MNLLLPVLLVSLSYGMDYQQKNPPEASLTVKITFNNCTRILYAGSYAEFFSNTLRIPMEKATPLVRVSLSGALNTNDFLEYIPLQWLEDVFRKNSAWYIINGKKYLFYTQHRKEDLDKALIGLKKLFCLRPNYLMVDEALLLKAGIVKQKRDHDTTVIIHGENGYKFMQAVDVEFARLSLISI